MQGVIIRPAKPHPFLAEIGAALAKERESAEAMPFNAEFCLT